MGCSTGNLNIRDQNDPYGNGSVALVEADKFGDDNPPPFGPVRLQVQNSVNGNTYLNWQDVPGSRFSKECQIESRDLMVQYIREVVSPKHRCFLHSPLKPNALAEARHRSTKRRLQRAQMITLTDFD